MAEHSTPEAAQRRYRMKRRLESIEETRRRITAAAFELHATVDPSRTTVSAIAERARVQRHTVYAHFPDLQTLYLACTEHGMRVTAMPEAGPWAAIPDPDARLQHALRELYAWYRANEQMLRNVLYDVDPSATQPTEPDLFELRTRALHQALAEGWPVANEAVRPTLDALLSHALAFETWASLTRSGLTNATAVELLAALAGAAASGTIAVRPEPGIPDQ
ncbi:MAG: TetR/AcrR family transcriptional regulator [Chloroflexi bacterium]|nr:TetR/AcrR family transcriptional regulator [Chloroflexota bacterium]